MPNATTRLAWAPNPASIEAVFAENAPYSPAHAYPALGNVPLTELRARFRDLSVPAGWKNDVLTDLVAAAQDGDPLAHLAVLVVLIPKAITTAASTRALRLYSLEDALAIYLTALWEQVLVHPLHRQGPIAASLTLGALHTVTKGVKDPSAEAVRTDSLGPEDYEALTHHCADPHAAVNAAEQAEKDVVELFAWALDSGTLTSEEVSLLSLWYLGGDEGRNTAIRRLGLATESARRHVNRIRSKLTSAVRQEIAANGWAH